MTFHKFLIIIITNSFLNDNINFTRLETFLRSKIIFIFRFLIKKLLLSIDKKINILKS